MAARDRLAEHYTPWVQQEVATLASTLGLNDRDNATGEVLASLAFKIMPGFDPGPRKQRSFVTWARTCIRRKLVDCKRRESNNAARLIRGSGGDESMDNFPDLAEQSDANRGFYGLLAMIGDREAVVVYLRYFRGLSVAATANVLGISKSTVKGRMRAALRFLRLRMVPTSGV